MKLTGNIIAQDHSIYPTNDGIFIFLFSAIDLTIIFGALPMYVMAPITTELIDIAFSTFGYTYINSFASPPAILKNKRYDGALSKNEDAREHSQK